MSKKKILHIITGLEVGGAETQLYRTLPKLQTYFDNRVCCIFGHGVMGKKLENSGVPVYYLDLKNIFDLGIIFRFKRIIKEFRPNILVTYLIHADLFGRVFGKLFGIKIIICSQRGSLLEWEFLRKIDKLTKFLVNYYIVQTAAAKKELMQKLNLPDNKFVVIPNSINLKKFDFQLDVTKKKNELKINTENINIVCVGNLRIGKGHDTLLQAFELAYKRNPHMNLLIAGDGNQKKNLLNQVNTYKSRENIYFLGNRNDIMEILKISNVFILLTLAEGMSNAIMEAMASGLAIITTDIEQNKELICNEKNGILIPANNVRIATEKILELSSNKEKRMWLAKNARESIQEHFSTDIIMSKLTNFLQTTIDC